MSAGAAVRPPQSRSLEWTLGDRMAKSRKVAGLTQAEMAEALDVSRASVTNYENDHHKPYRRTLRHWAEVTGVPVEWLLTGQVAPGQPATGWLQPKRRLRWFGRRGRVSGSPDNHPPTTGLHGRPHHVIDLRAAAAAAD